MELDSFFSPKTVAVIGASRNPEKVGHTLFKNLLDSAQNTGRAGKSDSGREVIPINPNAESILGKKAYSAIGKVKQKIDLAVIAVPAEFVMQTIKECGRKKVENLVIVTSGFSEVGQGDLEKKIRDYLNKNKMKAIGVNCLGIFDAYSSLNALFIPEYRMRFPSPGGISLVCQSGAIGLAVLDIAAEKGYKFSKFISYGNATQLDESDYLEYLAHDKTTKVICMYVEGVKDGEKFFRTAKKVSSKKPVIIVKGGISKEGGQATLSHTGSLAGKKEVYFGIFEQANIIRAENLEEMFNIASILENPFSIKGNRVQIITNGGGYGIISTDHISESRNLKLAELSPETQKNLRKTMPQYVNIRNPLDISGDATSARYKDALAGVLPDKNVDLVLLIALYQTPLISTDIVDIITEAKKNSDKPVVVVSTGSEFTENLSNSLSEQKVPVFSFPHHAIAAIDKIAGYYKKKEAEKK